MLFQAVNVVAGPNHAYTFQFYSTFLLHVSVYVCNNLIALLNAHLDLALCGKDVVDQENLAHEVHSLHRIA